MTTVEIEQGVAVTVEVYETRPTNSFNRIAVTGQDTLTANLPNQTLNLVAGSNIVLTTDSLTNTVTIEAASLGDIDGGSIV